MRLLAPQTAGELVAAADFADYVRDFLEDESAVCAVRSCDQRIEDGDFYRLDLRRSVLENCSFRNSCFENASFIDMVFRSCDLSNSRFSGAYFERCSFVSCKCVGADLSETVLKHTSFERMNFQYANFDKAKMTNVRCEETDFTEASLSEAVLKQFEAVGSRFIKNNFFKTPLAGIDFSKNEFLAPMVSFPPVELKGAVIGSTQAVDLVGLLGVVVMP